MKMILTVFLFLSGLFIAQAESPYEMSFEEIAEIRIVTAASLTESAGNKVPASITTITNEMIKKSGARSLDELLEIYVPNFMVLRHGGAGDHFGMRGIISDLDNKSLLLVNGRVMNHKATFGATTERLFSMLGDIDYINIVRGPGSSLYGPGAINGVIDIHTLNGDTFEGMAFQARQGFFEKFSLAEMKLGYQINHYSSIFFYYGLDSYQGADPSDSPLFFSRSAAPFTAGQAINSAIHNDHEAYAGKARHKAHIDFIHNNFRAWLRYTKGGLNYLAPRHRIEALGSFDMSKRSTFYQQLSLQVEYEKDISDTLSLRLDSGYDWTQIGEDRGDLATPLEHFLLFAEEEINSRVSLFWTPAVAHSFAFAVAHSREHFADDLLGIFGDNSYKSGSKVSSWHVDTFSLLSEYQWQLNSEWTFFLGGRGDRHKFSNWMWSPKIAIVHTPDENNSLKLIYNRSVRKTDDHVLRDLILSEAIDQAETETIESLELRLDHQHNDEYKVALSTFYYSHDVIAFLPLPINRVAPLGNAEAVGFELEVEYKGPSHEFIFSHAYTHLLNFTLEEDFVNNQVISSEPYGFGNEFQNWSPHITKFNWLWRLNDKFELNSSMQIMWAFPGASDYTDYNNNVLDKNNRSRSDGRQNAFNASIYLHSGLSYKQNEQVTWRLQAHNILGWLDKDFNKRNFYARLAGYRDQAAAVSISLEYKF